MLLPFSARWREWLNLEKFNHEGQNDKMENLRYNYSETDKKKGGWQQNVGLFVRRLK